MNYNKGLYFILFFVLFFYSETYGQSGKLSKAKQSLSNTNNTGGAVTKTATSTKNPHTLLDNDDDTNPIARIIFGIAAYSFYGVLFESPWEMKGKMHDAEIAYYPYKQANYGNFVYTDSTNYTLARLDVYNHFLIESNTLYGNDFGVDFKFLKRFGLDVNYTTFLERLPNKNDSFHMFSALLKYHRIRTQRFNAWFGIGFRSIFNTVNKTRFLWGFGGELFVKKPISIMASHKWATINSTSVRNTKLFLKYHLKNYRIASGYANYKLGVSEIKAFSLGIEASF